MIVRRLGHARAVAMVAAAIAATAAVMLVAGPATHARREARRPDPPPLPGPDGPLNLEARLRAQVDSLAGCGGRPSRIVFTDGNRWAVDYITRQMRRWAPSAHADSFAVRRHSGGSSMLANVTATVPGVSDSTIVICAHIDASASRDRGWQGGWRTMRAPGADDNATGIAAVLGVLELAAHGPSRPHYTLLFAACNGEERNPDYFGLSHADGHHLGSRALARSLKDRGVKVRAVIAMDMVGWNPRGDYLPLFSSSRSAWLARDLIAERDRLSLPLDLGHAGDCDKSDNESFARFGFPSVLLMESCAPWRSDGRHPRNPGYHTSRDTPALVTWTILTKVTRLVAAYTSRP